MTIDEAQRDMRDAYGSGAPGMAASALVWLSAGLVALNRTGDAAVIALLIGGMFIHPIGVLLNKALGRRGQHVAGNPLGTLALESTILMLLCLPLTYALSRVRVEWFFPAMLLVIGGRYLLFSTLFGRRIYWACGAVLALAAGLLVRAGAGPATGAFTGSAIEAMFAAAIFVTTRTEQGP